MVKITIKLVCYVDLLVEMYINIVQPFLWVKSGLTLERPQRSKLIKSILKLILLLYFFKLFILENPRWVILTLINNS